MIVSHRHCFVYLKCRKVGSTSVEVSLAETCGPDDIVSPLSGTKTVFDPKRRINWQNHVLPPERQPLAARAKIALGMSPRRAGVEFFNHMKAERIRALIGAEIFDGYLKIAIERNPWDREVSNWYFHHPRPRDRPPFPEFVARHTARRPIDNFDIYAIGGRIVADRMLRYERLAEDYRTLLDELGLDAPPLGRSRSGHRPDRDWRRHYDAESRDLVARLYAREIAAFGYDF